MDATSREIYGWDVIVHGWQNDNSATVQVLCGLLIYVLQKPRGLIHWSLVKFTHESLVGPTRETLSLSFIPMLKYSPLGLGSWDLEDVVPPSHLNCFLFIIALCIFSNFTIIVLVIKRITKKLCGLRVEPTWLGQLNPNLITAVCTINSSYTSFLMSTRKIYCKC